jgi:ribosome-binding factor A
MSKIRQERTAERIKLILSKVCRRDIRDPRLQDITITAVTIDRELQHANVFVNAMGDESRKKEVMAALEKANGFLRHELAQSLRVRSVPELHFRWDPSLEHAETVHRILEDLEIPPDSDDPVDF